MIPRVRFAALVAAICAAVISTTAAAQTQAGRTVRGSVYDSLSKAPLARAMVSIVDKSDEAVPPRSVETDSAGKFAFSNLAAGVYLIGFQAPLLDSLGVTSPTRVVELAPDGHGGVIVNLAVPSERTIHDAFCPNRPKNDSTSAFVGHLGDASTRGVVSNGEIDATWLDVSRKDRKVSVEPRMAQTHTGSDGWFALCDLPAGLTVAMHAIAGSDTSGVIYFQMPESRGLVRHEVYLADSRAPRDGIVVGRVIAAERQRPITGAQVRADATGATATSGDSGKFTLSGLPFGSSDILVRGIGFVPQRVAVDVLAGAPTSVTLSLFTSANMLDTVRVRASRTVAEESGWTERQKAGFGHFFDQAQIDRMQAFELSDIVRHVPGVRIQSGTNPFETRIMMLNPMTLQYNCAPAYWLDGVELLGIETTVDLEMVAPPEHLAGLEVYKDPSEIPAQFIGVTGRGCGAIVMWSLPPDLWNRHPGGP